jgi:NAD(P)-dependent dehydrogenase (short-subunit alcohol dehydrogenase family)
VVLADREPIGIERVAAAITASTSAEARAVPCDVTVESQLLGLVDDTEARFGPIDLFCSNAGVIALGGAEASDAEWRLSIDVNVLAHVYAARILVPRMLERGGGYLLQTASAAGLLTQLGSAPYSVTKHAALAFAEWLAITYGEAGLKVSVLAPQAVRTGMTAGVVDGGVAGVDGMLEPDEVAAVVVEGLDAEDFLILPHPEVLEYFRRKASDYDRWLNGMRRLQARFGGAGEPA